MAFAVMILIVLGILVFEAWCSQSPSQHAVRSYLRILVIFCGVTKVCMNDFPVLARASTMLKKKKRDKHNALIRLCSKAMILLVTVTFEMKILYKTGRTCLEASSYSDISGSYRGLQIALGTLSSERRDSMSENQMITHPKDLDMNGTECMDQRTENNGYPDVSAEQCTDKSMSAVLVKATECDPWIFLPKFMLLSKDEILL
ncbi:hypothetical protein ACRRTK_019288 [Alexandromys fortis]